MSAGNNLRVAELPYEFRKRQHGESKFDAKAALDFVALIVGKLSYDVLSSGSCYFASWE